MKYVLYAVLLILIGCNTAKQDIQRNATLVDRDLSAIIENNKAVTAAVGLVEETIPMIEEASDVIQEAANTLEKPISAPQLQQAADALTNAAIVLTRVQDTLTRATDSIDAASNTTQAVAENSRERVLSVLDSLNDVENTESGFLTNIISFIKKLSTWAIVVAVIVLLGSLGLWPMIVQGFIDFMSSGFLLFRRSRETAKLLYEVKERPSEDKVDNMVTHFRTGVVGEAAWRHEKKRREKAKHKKSVGQRDAPP